MCESLCFLPIYSKHQVRWTYQPGSLRKSHRISHPPSFCGACLNFSREKGSTVPFPRRPCFFIFLYQRFKRSPLVGHFFFLHVPNSKYTWYINKYKQHYCILCKYIYTYLPRMHLYCARTLNFLVELTTSRFGNLTRLIHITLLYVSGGRTY